jgi:hypothetical protein
VKEHGKLQTVGGVEDGLETGVDAGYRLKPSVELEAAEAELGDGALELAGRLVASARRG